MAPPTKRFCMFFCVATLLTNCAQSANILCLLGTPSIGHHVWNKSLLVALAERGHNLTVLTVEETERSIPGMHFIHMSGVYDAIYDHRLTSPKKSSIAAYLSRSVYGRIAHRYAEASQVDGWLVESNGVRRLLEYPNDFRFDLVMHDSYQAQALLGFVGYFGMPPLVSLSPAGEFALARLVGGVNYPSFQPHPMGPHVSSVMTIIERMRNMSYFLFDWFYRTYVYMVNENRKGKLVFGKSMRSLESIEENSAVILLNIDYALDRAHLLPPNVIPVGGLQAQRKDVMDSKLNQILDKCKNGAIYIYLASTNPFDVPHSNVHRHVLVRIFKELSHICFVWSTDDQHKDRLPSNVIAADWLPQNAILAHPNVKITISHGGRLTVQEAAWHAIPQLILVTSEKLTDPARFAISAGAAVRFNIFETYRSSEIIDQIHRILSNSSRYSLNAQLLSQRFRSTSPSSPMERAVHWIEEVTLKNSDFDHLRLQSTHLNCMQTHLVDIWFAILVVLFGFVCIFVRHCFLRKGDRSLLENGINNSKHGIKTD